LIAKAAARLNLSENVAPSLSYSRVVCDNRSGEREKQKAATW